MSRQSIFGKPVKIILWLVLGIVLAGSNPTPSLSFGISERAPVGWIGWTSLGNPSGIILKHPVRGANADKRQELFAIGGDAENFIGVWHTWQTTPNGSWSSWSSLYNSPMNCLAVRPNADGRLELLGVTTEVLHTWQGAPNGAWVPWESLGVPPHEFGLTLRCPIVAGQYADGRINFFSLGSDGNVWSRGQATPSGAWSNNWWSLGKPLGTTILGMAWGMDVSGREHIFVVGDDSQIYFNYQTTADTDVWSGWIGMGQPFGVNLSKPKVGWNDDFRMEIFAIGTDGSLWKRYQVAPNNNWSGWVSMGAPTNLLSLGPVVGRDNIGGAGYKMDVFVESSNSPNDIYHIGQTSPNNGWGSWFNLGHPSIGLAGLNEATQGNNADGNLVLFAVGNDGAVWSKQQSPSLCYSLNTTTDPSGSGVVNLNPAPNCFQGLGYLSETNVTLTAVPNNGYTFSYWGGDTIGSMNPTTITMNGTKNVTANFSASPTCYTLTLNVTPGGSVIAYPIANCNGGAQYSPGIEVSLTAVSHSGYKFINWSGDASGTSTGTSVTMNNHKTINANFARQVYLPLLLK